MGQTIIHDCLSANLCNVNLQNDILEDCDNPIFSGMNATAIIINKNDIKSVVRDVDNRRIIRSITFNSYKHAYRLVNFRQNPFTGTKTELEVNDTRNTFTRTFSAVIPTDGWNASKEIIDPLANGKFVVLVKNDWEHVTTAGYVDNKWQVYGIDRGLTASSLSQTKYENNDAWLVELTETAVSNSGVFFQHLTPVNTQPTVSLELDSDTSFLKITIDSGETRKVSNITEFVAGDTAMGESMKFTMFVNGMYLTVDSGEVDDGFSRVGDGILWEGTTEPSFSDVSTLSADEDDTDEQVCLLLQPLTLI